VMSQRHVSLHYRRDSETQPRLGHHQWKIRRKNFVKDPGGNKVLMELYVQDVLFY
jgi:hypothetical protein